MLADYFEVAFSLYYLFCLLYFLYLYFAPKRVISYLNFIILVFIPLIGVLILLALKFGAKEKPHDIDTQITYEKEKQIGINDLKKELDATSVTDVMLINDAYTKRSVVFDIFRGDSKKYVKELKKALSDEDTEVAHYASSALTEIKREYENLLIEQSAAYKNNPQDNELKIAYAKTLVSYIKCEIMDKSSQKKHKIMFCNLMRTIYEQQGEEISDEVIGLLCKFVGYLNETGKTDEALTVCSQLIEKYDDKKVYFTAMALYYNLGRKSDFFDVLDKLSHSKVVLNREEVETVRFFLHKDKGAVANG